MTCQLARSPVAAPRGGALAWRPAPRGFTLVELMVTLSIAAILMAIAVPSFRGLILRSRLNSSAYALSGGITAARMEAIKLNAPVQFCGTTGNGTPPERLAVACANLNQVGAVFSLPQGLDAGDDAVQVRAAPSAVGAPLQLTAAGVLPVRFSGSGFGESPSAVGTVPLTADVAILCVPTAQLAQDNRRLIRIVTGTQVMVETETGTCP